MKYIAKPTEPDSKTFLASLGKMFQANIYTNNGPLNKQFEAELSHRFGSPFLQTCSSGTMGLILASMIERPREKVITTPFTFAASSSAPWVTGKKILHVDVEGMTQAMDLRALEALFKVEDDIHSVISVPVYGKPYRVKETYALCQKYKIPLVMDGSHCFDVQYEGKHLWEYADIYVSSLHATKLMHCGEGGYIICKDEAIHNQIALLKNFGIPGEDRISTKGINGKLSEMGAALGLAVLPQVFSEILARKINTEALQQEIGHCVTVPSWPKDSLPNYQYFPVFFSSEDIAVRVQQRLKEAGLGARRYFYPALDQLYGQYAPVARDLASRVLCLPIHSDIEATDIENMSRIICNSL